MIGGLALDIASYRGTRICLSWLVMGGCLRTASGLWDQESRTPRFAITVSLLFFLLPVTSSTAFLLVDVSSPFSFK